LIFYILSSLNLIFKKKVLLTLLAKLFSHWFHVIFQDEQVEEIRDIIEMKVIHRRNIIKRKAKWGFESNSLIGLDLAGAANVIAPDAVDDEEY